MFPQQTGYECGPYALKHALSALGVFVSERQIARLAHTDQRGTDEIALGRAASALGAELHVERVHDRESAKASLQSALHLHHPVLLCVDNWEHWVAAVGADEGQVVVFDSSARPVVQITPWDRLLERLVYHDDRPLYDLVPVVRRTAAGPWAQFTPERAAILSERSELIRSWSEIALPLVSLAEAHADAKENGRSVPLETVLAHRRLQPVERGVESHRWAGRRRLDDMRFVCQVYGFRIAKDESDQAVDEIEQILTAQLR